MTCCGLFYPLKEQVKWWLAIDGGNAPTLEINLQTSELRGGEDGMLMGGWSTATGKIATARCAAAITFTVGTQTTDLPFIGLPTPDFIQRCDTGTKDAGQRYVATVKSKPFIWGGLLHEWGVLQSALLVSADPDGSIEMKLEKDLGVDDTPTGPKSCAPKGAETMTFIPLDNIVMAEAHAIQIVLTDGDPDKNWAAQRVDIQPSLGGRA